MLKINLNIAVVFLLVATTAMASAEQVSNSIYRYEVTLPEAKKPLEIQVKHGDPQTVKIDGKSVEYIKSETDIPASMWLDMVNNGTAPAHDFVTCNKKLCSYGSKGELMDQTFVTVRIDENEGRLITTSIYSKSIHKLRGKYPIPDVSTTTAIQKKELSVGDVLVVFVDKKRGDVQVKLVAVE
jgi:hypothetical protein